MSNFYRICPSCGSSQTYKWRKSYLLAEKRNSICKKCSSNITSKQIDRSFHKSESYRNKMSNSLKEARKFSTRYSSEEYREKLRIAKLNQIQRLGTQHSFNSDACKFIEEFGKKNGYNFQHALNGGEINVSGYLLDGYDKEKNVVFEYDEPKHNAPSVIKNDKKREHRIIKKLNPSMFIRYDEQHNRLYDVVSGKELCLPQ